MKQIFIALILISLITTSCTGSPIENFPIDKFQEGPKLQHGTAAMKIQELKKKGFLNDMAKDSYHSKKMVKEAQLILRNMVEEIERNYPNLNQEQELAILKRSIENFNALSEKDNNDIDTLAREQIINEMERIITTSGFKTNITIIDKWRTW
ncbi:DUF5713 family protein [Rufibacter aurantiacus]|uniref:DUF5713 family protein n=1 Tax=Rufibacter aurantiacus TaxID=2817374 RepID=UPI001B30B99C|nr:DUF5713 family protein [Rufibacter aurantiacus]